MPATAGKQVQGIVHLLLLYPCIRISCFNCTQPLGHTATIICYICFFLLSPPIQLTITVSIPFLQVSHLWKSFAFVASVLSETCHAPIHWMGVLIDSTSPLVGLLIKGIIFFSLLDSRLSYLCMVLIKRAEPTFKKSTSWNFMSICVLVEAQKSNGR